MVIRASQGYTEKFPFPGETAARIRQCDQRVHVRGLTDWKSLNFGFRLATLVQKLHGKTAQKFHEAQLVAAYLNYHQ